MGTSNWQQIPFCIEVLMKIAPMRVLDVGVGFGRWGMITREFGDVWYNRIFPRDWQVHVEGIEAFEANLAPYHEHFYDQIHRGDAADILETLPGPWDLVIFGDVIEHFAKDVGRRLLERSLARSAYVLVNVPLGEDWEQVDKYENEYERHLAEWFPEDFDARLVVRQGFFQDYAARPHASYCLSREDPRALRTALFSRTEQFIDPAVLRGDSQELDRVLAKVREMAFELDYIKQYPFYRLERRLRGTAAWRWLRTARGADGRVVTVRATASGGPAAQGAEVWLAAARANAGEQAVPWDFVEADESWEARPNPEFAYGRALVSSSGTLRVPVDEDPELTFATHPWCGRAEVAFQGRREVVDLHSDVGGTRVVRPARTPMVGADAAVPATNGTRPAAGTFTAEESAWIDQMRAAGSPPVAVHCPTWLGITASTQVLFEHTYAVPRAAGSDPRAVGSDEVRRHRDVLLAAGVEHVVFSGGDEPHLALRRQLAAARPGMRCDLLWHGSYVHFAEDYAWALLRKWVELARQGEVRTIGTVKKGMERLFERLGVASRVVLNYVPGTPLEPPDLPGAAEHVGIWLSGLSAKKLPHPMLAALALLPSVRLHAAGFDDRLREVVTFLGLPVQRIEPHALPKEALLAAIRETHASLYVTFSECCPMLPLESLQQGVPCLLGPTSHLFEDEPYLYERLVVPFPDRADVIADRLRGALDERHEIMRRYAAYVPGYNERARRSVDAFLG